MANATDDMVRRVTSAAIAVTETAFAQAQRARIADMEALLTSVAQLLKDMALGKGVPFHFRERVSETRDQVDLALTNLRQEKRREEDADTAA